MSVIRSVAGMLFLKVAPQDLPYDPRGTSRMFTFYVASGVIVMLDLTPLDQAVYSILLDIVVLVGFTYACLRALSLSARMLQTCTALFGTGFLFHLISWPMISILADEGAAMAIKQTLSLVFLMIISWQVLVYAHIYRHALSVDMTRATMLSIAYWVMAFTLSRMLLPVA